MEKVTAKYEVVMIFNVNRGEDGVKALSDKFKKLIEENGTIDAVEEWGKRRLAYPIEDELEGYYVLVQFTSEPDFPAELDRVFKITDGVLRSMIVRAEELPVKEQKNAPKAEVKTAPVAETAEEAPAEEAKADENEAM